MTDDLKKVYLGDSVYADWDGEHVIIYTDNGMGPQKVIFLDTTVQEQLIQYIVKLREDGK